MKMRSTTTSTAPTGLMENKLAKVEPVTNLQERAPGFRVAKEWF